MGKNLHYSILPFVKKVLKEHNNVSDIQMIDDADFYVIKVIRRAGYNDLYVVLSDDYYFGDYSTLVKHPILKNGGFILIARPEASVFAENEPQNKIGIGKIGILLGALNRTDYWNYEPPPPPKKST